MFDDCNNFVKCFWFIFQRSLLLYQSFITYIVSWIFDNCNNFIDYFQNILMSIYCVRHSFNIIIITLMYVYVNNENVFTRNLFHNDFVKHVCDNFTIYQLQNRASSVRYATKTKLPIEYKYALQYTCSTGKLYSRQTCERVK